MTKYYDKWKKGMKKGAGGKYYYPKKKGNGNGYKANYAKAKAIKKMPDSRPYVETKLREIAIEPVHMTINAKTGQEPLNSTIIVPPAWGQAWAQGLALNQINGRAIFIRYLKMKMTLDFSYLEPNKLYNLRCIWGMCTTTLENFPNATIAGIDDFVSEVRLQMCKSNLGDSNYIDFNSKRRSIKVLGNFQVRGDRQTSIAPQTNPGNFTAAQQPLKNLSFNFPMGRKAWLTEGEDGSEFFINRSWIPFVAFICPEFTGNDSDKTPLVTANSKLWYTDQ